MGSNRRNFLKLTGLGSLGLFGTSSLVGCSTKEEKTKADQTNAQATRDYTQQFNMHGYAAPALETVRMGITGLGNRGSGTVMRFASIEGVEIVGLNDLEEDRVDAAIQSIEGTNHNPERYFGGEEEWKRMCERDDIDLIAIATPWHLHTDQAVFAMEHGKHVFTELPAAQTVDDCWRLVDTSERTKRHCVQMSGSSHDGTSAAILNMIRQGLFGEIIHRGGGYIHDLMNTHNFNKTMYHNMWRLNET